MKEIYYQDLSEPFLLTDAEFFEALKAWNQKESYFCSRLEAILGPFIRFAKTPKDEDGREILVIENDKWHRKYFKNKKDKYFEILPGGQLLEVSSTKEIVDRLIPQEDLYNNKKLLR